VATRPRPIPDLGPDVASVSAVQMTALADLLDSAPIVGNSGTDVPDSAGIGDRPWGLVDRVLDHERRYWHASGRARRVDPTLTTRDLAVAG
jgi:hypothetical protein